LWRRSLYPISSMLYRCSAILWWPQLQAENMSKWMWWINEFTLIYCVVLTGKSITNNGWIKTTRKVCSVYARTCDKRVLRNGALTVRPPRRCSCPNHALCHWRHFLSERNTPCPTRYNRIRFSPIWHFLISEFKSILKGFDYVVSTSMVTAKSGRTLPVDQQDQQLDTLD
jgi:hypothetical protein